MEEPVEKILVRHGRDGQRRVGSGAGAPRAGVAGGGDGKKPFNGPKQLQPVALCLSLDTDPPLE